MAVYKISENKKVVKEDINNYDIVKMSIDVAVPAGKDVQSYERSALYRAFSDALLKFGYQMAGDYLDVEESEDYTQSYRDNGYEFFGEEE